MYDRILRLQLPKGVTVIGSADDIEVTIVAYQGDQDFDNRDNLANECRRLYDATSAIGETYTCCRQLARTEAILEWQKIWDNSLKGRSTYRIILDVSKWIKRCHGEVCYYLTQFLS